MQLTLELPKGATTELIRRAVAERRPLDWEAEILLLRALGLAQQAGAATDSEAANMGHRYDEVDRKGGE